MNNTKHHHVHEPLIRVAKRDGMSWWKSTIVRAVAIILALLACGVFMMAQAYRR